MTEQNNKQQPSLLIGQITANRGMQTFSGLTPPDEGFDAFPYTRPGKTGARKRRAQLTVAGKGKKKTDLDAKQLTSSQTPASNEKARAKLRQLSISFVWCKSRPF